jgi:hypothetical protein
LGYVGGFAPGESGWDVGESGGSKGILDFGFWILEGFVLWLVLSTFYPPLSILYPIFSTFTSSIPLNGGFEALFRDGFAEGLAEGFPKLGANVGGEIVDGIACFVGHLRIGFALPGSLEY